MSFVILPLILWLSSAPAGVDTGSRSSGPSDQHSVTIRFGGDVLLASHFESDMLGNPGEAFRHLYRLGGADATVVNLEGPVTTRGKKVPKPFNFRMLPALLSVLKSGGIDIVSIANNHIYDYGPRGLLDTISYLDSLGIRHVGAGRDRADAHRPVIDTLGGRPIAFFAYYGGGEAPAAGNASPGVARRELAQVCADLRRVRSEQANPYVVVILHWGTELATAPDRAQVAFAHALIDSGADAVIGHHPHVLQGIERYGRGVIAYSLGNLIFGGNERDSYATGLFEIRLFPGGVKDAFIPVRISRWRASPAAGDDSLMLSGSMRKLSSKFPKSIFNNQE